MFDPLPSKFDFPESERKILDFWESHDIFARSLEQRKDSPRFVFYEGPPTANGMPHPGHCLTRAIKDLFPRYQTMCGKLVERKAGWDTHGLPVEVEVCKQLGIHTKEEIEAYGLERFVKLCIESVFRYTREWEEMTRRLGFWVNLEDAYVTFHQSYVESVWWSLKTLFERGLLYQGHKVVWWWAQGGTALSAGEVGEGYREVDDPSVYVKFPLVEEGTQARRHAGTQGEGDCGTAVSAVDAEGERAREAGRGGQGAGKGERADRVWQFIERGTLDSNVADDAECLLYLTEVTPNAVEASFDSFEELLQHLRSKGRGFVERLFAPTSLLVWTTTPWTLISNHFAAVHRNLDYALTHDAESGENMFIAKDLVEKISKKTKRELEVLFVFKGEELIGQRYIPPFSEAYYECPVDRMPGLASRPGVYDEFNGTLSELEAYRLEGGTESVGWRVLAADFVTIESGTGLVHEAPAFGEVDFDLLQEERKRFLISDAIPLINAVAPNGEFTDDAPEKYRGRWVKDCDKDIIRELRDERKTPWGTPLLLHQEQVRHDYPFCPRAEDDPLIQYARKSWFVRTSQFKDEFVKNNDAIRWLPEHIKEGRFGDFLRNNVDWALSRERYWGTPLPIWVCERTGRMEAIGSYEELLSKPGVSGAEVWEQAKAADPSLPDHLRVHKPYIDAVTYDSPFVEGGAGVSPACMKRVTEVIDCWWDAGSMPFAQWGFPHAKSSEQKLAERFPADFISEAIDQTRGWFYALLAINTLLFGKGGAGASLLAGKGGPGYPLPYRACIVLGHMLGEDGLKMSKRLKNYKEPSYVFDRFGADAMRWFFFSAQTPWTSVRFQENGIRDAQREFMVRLYNVFSFFNIYANIDGFEVGRHEGTEAQRHEADATGHRPIAKRSELDRWVISELHLTVRAVRESLDRFESFPAARRLNAFVDALSNWYVRRSRDRFWKSIAGGERGSGIGDQGSGGGERGAGIGDQGSGIGDQRRGRADFSSAAPQDAVNQNQDKWDAYNTLYECLLTLSKLIAPFTPFFAETMYQTLEGSGSGERGSGKDKRDAAQGSSPLSDPRPPIPASVHLCDYPESNAALIDEKLAEEMELVREIASLGRAARTEARLKVRQPLARVEIILTQPDRETALRAYSDLLAEELNVKLVEFTADPEHYVLYQVKPNFKAIGPKYGKLAPKIAAALKKLDDPAEARRALGTDGKLPLALDGKTIELGQDEVEIRLEAREGWSAAQGRCGVIVVATELSDELKQEGVVRELIHHVQTQRKSAELAYEARIVLRLHCDDAFHKLVERFAATLERECLIERIEFADFDAESIELEGHTLSVAIEALA